MATNARMMLECQLFVHSWRKNGPIAAIPKYTYIIPADYTTPRPDSILSRLGMLKPLSLCLSEASGAPHRVTPIQY